MQVKKQQLEPDTEQQTSSKLGKEYVKAVYCHPAYLTYMKSTACEMPGWMKHKFESSLQGEISITPDTQMTPPLRHHPYFVKHNWVTINFGFSLSQYCLLWRYCMSLTLLDMIYEPVAFISLFLYF